MSYVALSDHMFTSLTIKPMYMKYGSTSSIMNLACKTQSLETPQRNPHVMLYKYKASNINSIGLSHKVTYKCYITFVWF